MTTAIVKDAYQNVQVARDYDAQRFADPVGRAFDRIEKRAIASVLRAALEALPDTDLSVLDAPCGTGRITELLLDAGLNTTGGDISPQMIDVARTKLDRFGDRIAFRRVDLDRVDLPDNSFDIVTCIRLFHHLESPDRAAILAALAKVTRRFIIVNVSYSSPYYRLRRRAKRLLGQDISRTSSTRREIDDELCAAGLTLRRMHFILPGISENAILLLEKT